MSKKDQEATPSPSIPSPSSIMAFSSTASSLNTPTSAHPIAHDDIDLKIAEFKKNWIASGHQGPEAMHGCHEYLTFNPRQWGLKDRPARERSPSTGGNLNDIHSMKLDWVVPICPPTITGWAAGTQIPHMSSREKGTPVTTSHPNGNIRPHFYYSPPSPPFTQLHKYLEEFEKLPSMPSPTLPPWPTPARSVTGGKQPGKVPNVPLNLGGSSDDSSDSGSDSDSSEAESENVATSDGDGSSRQRKSIGRKTAQRRNSKPDIGGKRPAGTTSGKAVPESTRPYSKDAKARKTSRSQFCTVLNEKQISDMVRRYTASGLSRSPVVVKINIPSFAKSSSRLTEKSRTSPKTRPSSSTAPSKYNSPSSRRKGDYSSSDEDRDRKVNGSASRYSSKEMSRKQDAKYADGRSKRSRSHSPDISESEDRRKGRTKAKDRKRDEDKDMFYDDNNALGLRSPRPSDSPLSKRKSVESPGIAPVDSRRTADSRSKRIRSYSPDSSGSDDKRHPRARSRDRDYSSKDTKHGIKSPLPTKSSTTKSPPEPKSKQPMDSSFTDAKRSSISVGSSTTDKGMTDRVEKNGTSSKGRTKDTQSLSPVSERPKDRSRLPGYHSTDEADAEETIKRRRRESSDEPKSRSQAVSALEIRSRTDSGSKEIKSESAPVVKKRSDSRDRTSKDADVRRSGKDADSNGRETKDRSDRTLASSTKERRVSKDEDGTVIIPIHRAGASKGDSGNAKSDRTGSSTAVPSSPRGRTNRDSNKDTKSRTDKDARDDTSHRSSTTGTKDRDRGTKDRARGRSRSRTRSRSPRGRYDRSRGSPLGRDSKGNRDRRDYDDDRSSRRKTDSRQRDNSRDRNDRGRARSRDRFARDRSRDRSRERSLSRDKKRRSRSRERMDVRKDLDRRTRERSASPISARSDSRLNLADSSKSSLGGRRESESKHGASSSVSSNSLRRPSQAIKEEVTAAATVSAPQSTTQSTAPTPSTTGSVATPSSAPASDSKEGLARSTSSGSLATTPTVKRMSIEDYQRKRVQVDTPKAASDSPALSASNTKSSGTPTKPTSTELKPSSSNGSASSSGADSAPTKPTIRPEVAEKIAQYFNTYRVRRSKGVTYKHSADDNFKKKSEQKLSAIQYFLSTIEFIAAFHANDKYHSLSNPGRPDIAVKESITSWETMRQFINSLTVQCHTNGLLGLDGLSALLEVLVCFKVYSYHTATLRKEMHKIGQFEPAALAGKEEVAMTTDLAARLLKNVDDWAQIQKRMDDCRNWLTPDVARLTFPESFRRWCIHPDQIGSTNQFERTVSNTGIQKIIWPLGTHIHLHELMGFVDAALTEYQRRTGLRDPGVSH